MRRPRLSTTPPLVSMPSVRMSQAQITPLLVRMPWRQALLLATLLLVRDPLMRTSRVSGTWLSAQMPVELPLALTTMTTYLSGITLVYWRTARLPVATQWLDLLPSTQRQPRSTAQRLGLMPSGQMSRGTAQRRSVRTRWLPVPRPETQLLEPGPWTRMWLEYGTLRLALTLVEPVPVRTITIIRSSVTMPDCLPTDPPRAEMWRLVRPRSMRQLLRSVVQPSASMLLVRM